MKIDFDVVVIGAGSGGLTAAVGASKVGKKVLLVEKAENLGGECTNAGCIPSKALLHHAKSYHSATSIAGKNSETEEYRSQAFSYVRSKIDEVLEHEQPTDFEKLGITVIKGEAEFVGPCSIKVKDQSYIYKNAIIATGTQPRPLDVPGLKAEDTLTNESIFNLSDVPSQTLIIGSGPIGMEMGQALAMLGSKVTIVSIDSEFARLEDEALRPIIKGAFEKLGIEILLNARVEKVEEYEAVVQVGGEGVERETRVKFDKVLIAIGRVPNLPKGLSEAGIKFDERCVLVDSQFRTSNRWVYAIGDVSQRLKFTHTADDSARQVVTRLVSRGWLRVNRQKAVPKVTYTEPEIAQVGFSWPEAMKKYSEEELMRIEVPFSESDRARTDDDDTGKLVVIARRLSGSVLGAHLVGPRAGELITIFTLAIDQKLSLWNLRRLIYAYPTYSLIVKKAGDYFFAKQLASLKSDLLALLKRNSPKLIAGFFWITLLYFLYQYQQSHDMSVTDTALVVFDFITMTVWGPLVYILAYTIRPLTFFPGTALTILSGLFFGLWGGIIYTILAANLSSSLAYFVGKFFGGNLKLEDTVVGNWVEALQKNPFESVLTTRLIFLPFDIVSYASGILRIPFVPFITATFVGTILGIATFVSIGASLELEDVLENGLSFDAINSQFIALSAAIFLISIVLSRVLKKWRAES